MHNAGQAGGVVKSAAQFLESGCKSRAYFNNNQIITMIFLRNYETKS